MISTRGNCRPKRQMSGRARRGPTSSQWSITVKPSTVGGQRDHQAHADPRPGGGAIGEEKLLLEVRPFEAQLEATKPRASNVAQVPSPRKAPAARPAGRARGPRRPPPAPARGPGTPPAQQSLTPA